MLFIYAKLAGLWGTKTLRNPDSSACELLANEKDPKMITALQFDFSQVYRRHCCTDAIFCIVCSWRCYQIIAHACWNMPYVICHQIHGRWGVVRITTLQTITERWNFLLMEGTQHFGPMCPLIWCKERFTACVVYVSLPAQTQVSCRWIHNLWWGTREQCATRWQGRPLCFSQLSSWTTSMYLYIQWK